MDSLSLVLHNLGQHKVQPSPYQAVRQAAGETGADFDYLWRTAQRESALDPTARATTSSATGLFQFTNDTWLRMMERYGEKYGIGDVVADTPEERDALLALREDPVHSARMAGELANENKAILGNRIGREPTSQELYAAHFLGPSGAGKLIEAARETPSLNATELFPDAAAANPGIFRTSSGGERSVAAVYARLTGDVIANVDAEAETAGPQQETIAQTVQAYTPAASFDGPFNAAEALSNARARHALMAALIGMQTGGDDSDGNR